MNNNIKKMKTPKQLAAEAIIFKEDVFFPNKEEFLKAKDLRPDMIAWSTGFIMLPASWFFWGWDIGLYCTALFFLMNFAFFHGRYKV